MNQTLMNRSTGIIFVLGLSIGFAYAHYAPGTNLYMNGGLASSRVLQHNGTAYVPIADVAKALNQTVASKADGYALTPAGGANQVSGLNGKIGDRLTNGEFVVTVTKVLRTDKYERQLETGEELPRNPGDDVVVVLFHVKNASQKTPFLVVSGGEHTALTDQDEHSYVPSAFAHDCRTGTPTMLPGSAVDFALVYSVPKSEKLGDMVYQIRASGSIKETDFRISMAGATL